MARNSLASTPAGVAAKADRMLSVQSTRMRSGLLAVVAGSTVANLYYSQPILASLGQSLSVSASCAGSVAVATLVGNGLAQLLLVPLADKVERRRLTQVLLMVQAAAMVLMASAHRLSFAAASSLFIGLGGAAAMVIVPYAAAISDPAERGRSTGTVMAGVLLGILFSRSISGFISSMASWRMTYLTGAGLALVAAVLLGRFPALRAQGRPPRYRHLLVSVTSIALHDRLVQRRMAIGALGFVSFNVLWTGLTLLLSAAPYHYSPVTIGLFGVVGLVGALTAKNAGTWFDQGHGPTVSRLGWAATGAAWLLLLAAGQGHLLGLSVVVAGIALLDAGMQAQHITNQSTLLAARPDHTARVTTAYMSANVVAGAAGSALASALYPAFGWIVLVAMGIVCSIAALCTLPRTTEAGPR
ncbi:MFS transporter [Streptomyces sp. col6]|uniref:MFS transporter n=1 Tax=Streptomyces sp. col6 TaxID=2478958 RepID=UPI0011CE5517|nr:MFS transporter [Streptomyces sp. col6]TXR99693.1 MFS transporter [Streptomyces sp. col6]